MSSATIMRVLSAAYRCAERAGAIATDIFRKGDLKIVEKGFKDLQTEADRAAQRTIVASLQRRFPQLTIIGEEQLENDSVADADLVLSDCDDILQHSCPAQWSGLTESDLTVWVDPLDGTAEYTEGLVDQVTVLIGISAAGEAVAGVVHQPFWKGVGESGAKIDRTLWGVVGLGAFGPLEPQQFAAGTNIVTTTRSHPSASVLAAVDACEPSSVLRVGGAGNKVLLVLEHRAHAYVFASPGCKKWDTCAPEALLVAANGRLTDIAANPIGYDALAASFKNAMGVLAVAPSVDFNWYSSRIPRAVIDDLAKGK